ncbi:peptidoglycan-binding protein [Streptomyces sp. NPDC000851]
MEPPVFEEFDPTSDCDCPGCAHWRRVPHVSPHSTAGRPAATRALAVAAMASAALGVSHTVPALAVPHAPHRPGVPAGEAPATPQGGRAPLYGPGGTPAKPAGAVPLPEITRAEIINRAKKWVAEKVPYSMTDYWTDGYRQDCSGFVSMAWKLPGNEWTGSLHEFGVRITKEELQPGDMLLFHNPANPQNGSHVVLFGGWTDYTHTYYIAYESTRPQARRQTTPYAYWTNSDRYVPYRYKGVKADVAGVEETAAPQDTTAPQETDVPQGTAVPQGTTEEGRAVHAGAAGPLAPASRVPAYPGRGMFRPGADNAHVTLLGKQLVRKGFGKHYAGTGPGPRWGEADRRNVEAFQRSQGWRGGAADGYPGPETWRRLFS